MTNTSRLAVLYDRASTAHQKNNWSRDDAKRFLDTVVAEHKYDGEFRQEIRSGESLVDRPVMKRLLEEIADAKVAALVCQDFTRLSRDEDGIDGRIIRQVCRDAGTLIITPEKVYNFDNDGDDLLADLNFFVGKIHKRQSLLALTRGMKEKARQGKLQPTYARFGYEWTERWPDDGSVAGVTAGAKKPGADMVVVVEEADLVRRVFDLYEQVSQRQVAIRLNGEGLRKPVKSRAWRHKTQSRNNGERVILERDEERLDRLWTPKDINDIISNPMYAGLLVWGVNCTSRFMKDFEGAQHHRPNLQIVSLEQFNRCQRLMRERRRVPPSSVGSPYVFSGVLRCRHCGGRMVGKRQKERRSAGQSLEKRYECRAYHVLGKQGCRGQSVYETTAKKAFLPAVVDLLDHHLQLDDALREVAGELAGSATGQRREGYAAELSAIASAQERLVDAVAQGLLPPEAIRRKQLDLMEKKEQVEKRLAALQRNRESTAEIARALELVQSDLGQLLDTAPEPQLARLCRLVFRSFSVDVANGRSPTIGGYEFTPEFADLLAARASTPATDTPAWEIVWCGARNGRRLISGVSGGSSPATE